MISSAGTSGRGGGGGGGVAPQAQCVGEEGFAKLCRYEHSSCEKHEQKSAGERRSHPVQRLVQTCKLVLL